MPRVLLTGASGMVGANVLEYLLDKTDWEFVCICSWRHRGNPLRIEYNHRVTVITHDLTGPIPDIGEFDYIVHIASESHVDRSIADPVPFVENNVSSTLQMLEYARKHPCRTFIQFSTDEVYGTAKHDEWDVLVPSNPYAASKAAQEMIAISYWRTYGIPVVITNSNNIVGKYQDEEKFVPKIAALISQGKEVTIHTANGKPGVRYWNPVLNIADALLYILTYTSMKRYPNVQRPNRYNLPGGLELDNLEMAQLVADIMGKKLKYKLVDAETVRKGYDQMYAPTEGTLTKLGWKPPFTLPEGLKWLQSP